MEFVPNRAWKGLANVKSRNKQENEQYFLTCERDWVYFTLIAVAGFWGAYTYLLRGSVFCNAQTGNVVLMGLALGSGQWRTGLYYLVPISAYVLGAFVSELAPNPDVYKRQGYLWPMTNTMDAELTSSDRALAMTRLLTLVRFSEIGRAHV